MTDVRPSGWPPSRGWSKRQVRRMATGASRRARERLRAARRLLFEQVPEQLGRLEHYGAHLARQQDQARAQLERLEHYGAHVSGQNDRSLAMLEQITSEV